MKKFIIVTGGAGFVGSNLIEYLLKEKKYKIISLDNYSSGSLLNHIKHKNVQYIKCETKNIKTKLNRIKNNIKVVFHFGEFSRIYQSFLQKEKCLESNLNGTLQVFLFCLENKIKIVYSATSASLGNNGMDQNLSPYSFTKAKNLDLLSNLRKWFGLCYEALYFYNVYGPRQIENGKMATVIGIFERLYKQKKSLTVVKPGTQSRKFTHIRDTVKGCYYAWKKNKNRHYILSNKHSYSIAEVAKMFKSDIKLLSPRLGERVKSSVVKKDNSNTRLHRIPCSTNLKSYINNFKNNLGM